MARLRLEKRVVGVANMDRLARLSKTVERAGAELELELVEIEEFVLEEVELEMDGNTGMSSSTSVAVATGGGVVAHPKATCFKW